MKSKKTLAEEVREIINSQQDKRNIVKEYQRFLQLSMRLDALFGRDAEREMASPMQIHRQSQAMIAQGFDMLHHI